MDATRFLLVIADDYGIGPETSRGILELARDGIVTGTVLLLNSPYAATAVRDWRRAAPAADLGWHPCLTLDPPVADPGRVPRLVGPNGSLWPLRQFLTRLVLGRITIREIEIELMAQFDRFVDLTGRWPAVVNAHHHVNVFPPVGRILRRVLSRCRPLPYLRRVREPWRLLGQIPGARLKRGLLGCLGALEAQALDRMGYPGNDWLAGITDPPWVKDTEFFTRWLRRIPGRVVELTCHPGHRDDTLLGRDCTPRDGMLGRRVSELHLLRRPSFGAACRECGLTLVAPSQLGNLGRRGWTHAA